MEIEIPYGQEHHKIGVDADVRVLMPRQVTVRDEHIIIKQAIENPLGGQSFSDFMSSSRQILVLVTDATRPTPTDRILSSVHHHFTENHDVKYMVAVGTHRAPTDSELGIIFGKYYQHVKDDIIIHDAYDNDNLVYVGTTSRGTEVKLNKIVVEAEAIIAINNVKPHYFAGFTGGRKLFLPGVAAYSSIETNHSYALDDASQPLALKANPVAEDMAEAALFLGKKHIFSIQTVMTEEHRLYAAFSGDLEESFLAACRSAKEIYSVPIKEKANIVLTATPYPMDIDLYQSQHALENCKSAIEDSGIMILVSKCRDGVGNSSFLELLDKVETPEQAEELLKGGYKLGYHKSLRIMKMKRYAELWAVTDLDDDTVKRAKMRPYHGIQSALDDAIEFIKASGREPRIIIIPNGGMTVPYLADL